MPRQKVKGLDKVLKNLNKEIQGIENRSEAGLMAAGLFIKRESQLEVPVQHGFLKAGAYVDPIKHPSGPVVEIGYIAKYAPFVHEMPMKLKGTPRPKINNRDQGLFWDPQGKGKSQFLRDPISRNTRKILNIIKHYSKIQK